MLAQLFALLATGEAGLLKRRMKTAAAAYAAAAIAAFLALVFLVTAAYLAAATRWGAINSAIWFGVGFVVLTILVLVVYRLVDSAQRRAQQRQRAADATKLAGATAVAMLPSLLRQKGGVVALLVGLATLAGYATYRGFERHPGKDQNKDAD